MGSQSGAWDGWVEGAMGRGWGRMATPVHHTSVTSGNTIAKDLVELINSFTHFSPKHAQLTGPMVGKLS